MRQDTTTKHVDIPFRDIDAHLMIENQIGTTHLTRVVAYQKPGLCFCVVQVEITLQNEIGVMKKSHFNLFCETPNLYVFLCSCGTVHVPAQREYLRIAWIVNHFVT